MKNKQTGFTLVEIAIVLVIIGLLLGGILKGQELINSARVRNLADTNAGIQAAYYGFIDRYRAVPGDMSQTLATQAIGQTITVGGNGNGRIDDATYDEASALWNHLTLANFLQGGYVGDATTATTYEAATHTPVNPFNGYMLLGLSKDYSSTAGEPTSSTTARLSLLIGDNIPVDVARELDVKIDDTLPLQGTLRYTTTAGNSISYSTSEAGTSCTDSVTTNLWDIASDEQACSLIYLY